MEQYNVTGMSCAACSARVEKAVLAVDGVEACSVNLLTNSMQVEGTVLPETVIAAVENAGYGAVLKGEQNNKSNSETQFADETSALKKRLVWSVAFLLPLMYVSMGHAMWGFPLPTVLANNPLLIGIIQLLITVIIMVINKKFFISGAKGILHLAPNMDTLVSIGAGAAFVYSAYVLFAMTQGYIKGDFAIAAHLLHELYFESAAMILTLITVGKMLESVSKGKTADALKSLINLAPKTATVIRNEREITVPINDVIKNDIFIVKPGDSIPVDGVVIEGESAINESALTGESIPVDKQAGDIVSAATVNQSGFIKCRAVRVGEDTIISQIIKMVGDAATTKPPIAKVADKVSGVFVPIVIAIAVITIIVWQVLGSGIGFSLARGISVLVISCPCALGLATPVAIMVGSGVGAKNGILYKTAASLEAAGRVKTVALDKTGTITKGEPTVTDVIAFDGTTENELVTLAASLEIKSEHPLGKAVVDYGNMLNVTLQEVSGFKALVGNGLKAEFSGGTLLGGSLKFAQTVAAIKPAQKETADRLAQEGKTPLFFIKNDQPLGIIAVADKIKEDSFEAILDLKRMGLKVVMLTGDNERTAAAVGEQVGVDEVVAGVLPSGKESAIKKLRETGAVAMVGDGINDALALATADIGIAIGAGTDVAIDAADIVIMKSRLGDVVAAIKLGRATLKNIRENLFWAFVYNCIGIPLAAGVFTSLLGWSLNPMFGAAAMSLSSFCVVTNALRLNFVKLNLKPKVENNKEKMKMEKAFKIEGMMCPHCEAAVKKCLEAIDGVESAVTSHEKGTAVVTYKSDVADEVIIKAITDAGYKVM